MIFGLFNSSQPDRNSAKSSAGEDSDDFEDLLELDDINLDDDLDLDDESDDDLIDVDFEEII